MKKALTVILVFALIASAIVCASNCSTEDIKEPSSVSTVTQRPASDATEAPANLTEAPADATEAPENNTEAPTEAPTEVPSKEVAVEETVLVDEKNVKVTLKSFEDDGFLGPELKILVENGSGKSLTFTVEDVSVNGYMNDAGCYVTVADGKKANDEISLSSSDLKACGIETIADIELSFRIYDSDSYDEYLRTEPISIRTSAYEGFEYVFDESGTVAYEGKGIKIVVKGLTDSSIFGKGVLFYIFNGTDDEILVTSEDVSVNGFMVDDLLFCTVLPGKHAVDAATLLNSSLEENGIEEIESVELYFHIINYNTFRTIVDTDPIKVDF